MTMGFAGSVVTGTWFAVDQDGIGPGASPVEFQADLMRRFQYLRVRSVCCRAKWKMMKRGGTGDRSVSEQLHVSQSTREVHGDRVADLRQQYEVVFTLVQVHGQLGGVATRPTMLAAIDNHVDVPLS